MKFLPSIIYLSSLLSFYVYFKKIKIKNNLCVIYSYIGSLVTITFFSKIIILFKIISVSQLFFFLFFFLSLIFIFFNYSILLKDVKKLIYLINKNKFYKLVFVLFCYIFIQGAVLPPSNFDSLAYHIQRNYLFINGNSIYPLDNAHYANQIFQPLNFDLLYFTHAIFQSNVFLSIFSFISFVFSFFALRNILIILKIRKGANFILLIFLSFSSILLAATSTKNDIMILAFALASILLIYDFTKENNKSSIIFFLLGSFYAIGIKWNFLLFLFLLFVASIALIIKKKLFYISLKNFFIFLPLIIILSPFETVFNNLNNNLGPFGSSDYVNGHSNPDGFYGGISNLLRNYFLLFDITIPIQKIGLTNIINYYNDCLDYILIYLFDNNKLGIANEIKWLSFDYSYNLKPHSDYAGYSLTGFAVSIIAFYYIFFGKEKIFRILATISFFYFLLLSLILTWQPWILRFFMVYVVINLIVSSKFLINLNYKIKKLVKIFCFLIICFNISMNVSQPILQHSNTNSWFTAFFDRDNFQIHAIPELNKINQFVKICPKNKNIALVMEKGGSQTPYEIIRKCPKNKYYFADKDLNNFLYKNILNQENRMLTKFEYIINLSKKKLKYQNFIEIQKKTSNSFQILKSKF